MGLIFKSEYNSRHTHLSHLPFFLSFLTTCFCLGQQYYSNPGATTYDELTITRVVDRMTGIQRKSHHPNADKLLTQAMSTRSLFVHHLAEISRYIMCVSVLDTKLVYQIYQHLTPPFPLKIVIYRSKKLTSTFTCTQRMRVTQNIFMPICKL